MGLHEALLSEEGGIKIIQRDATRIEEHEPVENVGSLEASRNW